MSVQLEQKISDQYLQFRFDKFLAVDNSTERIMVDNLSFRYPNRRREIGEALARMQDASSRKIIVLDAECVAESFNRRLKSMMSEMDPAETVLLIPGTGAQDVYDLLDPGIVDSYQKIALEVKRVLDKRMRPIDVLVSGGGNTAEVKQEFRWCVLIDDVIGSGSTAIAVRQHLSGNADWIAAAWLSLSPLQSKQRKNTESSLPSFTSTFSSVVYHGNTGIPANNSLSTFGGDDEKAWQVIARYQEREVQNIAQYRQAITILRRITNE